MPTWINQLRGAASGIGDRLREFAKHTSRHAEQAVERGQETLGAYIRGAGQHIEDTWGRWVGEDRAAILDHCPIATSLLAHRDTFGSDPASFGLLYNVRVRPVLTAAVLAAGGIAFEDTLARLTRQVFDGRQLVGGWAQSRLEEMFGADTTTAVNAWIDTVPGAAVPGGGVLHRIQHGHDAAAIADVFRDHGSEAGLQALYHVFGRDFLTPTGIPILPSGSNEVHEYLTATLNISPADAADLLSINCIEILSGVFMLVSLFRVVSIAKVVNENLKVRDLVERSTKACEAEDFMTAAALLDETLVLRRNDPILTFLRAAVHHRSGSHLQAHFDFEEVVKLTARDEPAVEVGGARISFRGLAAMGALTTSDALAKSPDYRSAWLEHVMRLARAAITAFEVIAHDAVDRRLIRRISRSALLPPRPLSAALNLYLAGRVAGAAMYLPERERVLVRITTKLGASFASTYEQTTLSERRADLDFIRRFISAELGPLPG